MIPAIGQTIGHYRVVEQLGGGGMGVVYRAEDVKLGRIVALKFLPPEWSRDLEARQRFLREARAASALEDSRICTIFDIDETEDGQLFIAMAYYEGESLASRLERGRLPLSEAVDLAVQTAEGLERAHSVGIIHRDIKPANLMLTHRHEVVIVDFGLAKLAGELSLTKPGSTMGTPHYMSPEQARGDRADHRTDLWSLGVVLYEMLTGRRPFDGANDAAVARSILDDRPPPLASVRPDAPPELCAIVDRLLQKDAGRRFANASDLLAALKTLRESLVELERPTLDIPATPARSRRSGALVALVSMILLIAALAVWVVRQRGAPEPAETALPRIVVLPFDNLGPPDDEYFADGITEEIISRLASVSALQVISRTSAMHYKGEQVSLGQISAELDVGFVLEGSIRWDRDGGHQDRVRVTPRLIRVADDSSLWSHRYDRVLEDIFSVQTDIAQQVVAHLQATLLEPERRAVERRPTDDMDAYQAYLVGTRYLRTSAQEEIMRLGIGSLERAVELDPEFAEAHAMLSEAHSGLFHYRYDFTTERLDRARESAERALRLEPDLPEGHRALGWYYYWGFRDYDRALEEFSTALEALPNDPSSLRGRCGVFKRKGRWDDALQAHEAWRRVDPQSYLGATDSAVLYLELRRFESCDTEVRRAISIAPDRPDAYVVGASNYLGWDGATDRARRFLESGPGITSPIFDYMFDLYDRRPASALSRLDDIGARGLVSQELIAPKDLLRCVCLVEMDERSEAKSACQSAVEALGVELEARPHDHRVLIALGHAYSLLGRNEDAVRAGERALGIMPISKDAEDGSFQAIELAKIYTRVGEADRALDLIDELLSVPNLLSVGLLRLDPVWDPLRDLPRFQTLLEKHDTAG